MNVVFVIYNAHNAGAVMSTTRRQLEALSASGHRVLVISNEPTPELPTHSQRVDSPDTVLWRAAHRVAQAIFSRVGAGFRRWDCRQIIPFMRIGHAAMPFLRRLLDAGQCDHVFINQHPSILGLHACRERVPVTLIAHGDIFSHPANAFSWPTTAVYRHSARVAYRRCDSVITVSGALRERAVSLGADPARVVVVPNGIDELDIGLHGGQNFLPPFADARPSTTVRLLYVGRFAEEKGVDTLLTALARLPRQKYQLTLCGDGPQRAELISLSARLGLTNMVTFAGSIPRQSLGAYYLGCDLVCLPSRSEAQPVVTLESMITGRPIIASRVGGVPDSVTDGVTGVLVPPDDPPALAGAIDSLGENPEQRVRMGHHARERVATFRWERVTAQFLETVERLHFSARTSRGDRGGSGA